MSRFNGKDIKEGQKFLLGMVMGGGLFLVHPTIGRIVIGLSIAGLSGHMIDRVVEDKFSSAESNKATDVR